MGGFIEILLCIVGQKGNKIMANGETNLSAWTIRSPEPKGNSIFSRLAFANLLTRGLYSISMHKFNSISMWV